MLNIRNGLLWVVLWVSGIAYCAGNGTNVLLITADDLGYEAVNCTGGEVPNVTPNMDALAASGMNFRNGFVNCAICAPSRSVIATGRYGFSSGLFGFNKLTKKIPTLFGAMRENGYRTGILGKVSHSTPDPDYEWDFTHDYAELGMGRSPKKYYEYSKAFMAACKKAGKPFYFMVNSHDPHRPFHNPAKANPKWETPSRLFKPEEIVVPSYLTDLPEVREEIAHYYNSVRRFDDTVGKVLQALDESGMRDNTIVVLVADNGSAFPFGKANTYLASGKSPFLIRWPGGTKPNMVDDKHFVSTIDLFPTLMDVCGLPHPAGVNGRSLKPILRGGTQSGREQVFTQIDYTIGGPAKPMRCIQDKKYAYIFNGFSDGKFQYRNNNEGSTFKAMQAATDDFSAERVKMFRYRVPQEFYDLEKDPGCVNNLVNSPEYAGVVAEYQARLRKWMVDENDHCISFFDVRNDADDLAQKMKAYPKLVRTPAHLAKVAAKNAAKKKKTTKKNIQ